jgi:hypothetical protein
VVNYALPFTFYFNNAPYTSVWVHDNGSVYFNATAPSTAVTSPISTTAVYNGVVSAFGFYLRGSVPAGSLVRCGIEGTSPNRVFVAQYDNVLRGTALTAFAGPITMQIRLYETTGVIETLYKGDYIDGLPSNTAAGEVGLRGATNTDFNNRTSSTAFWTPTSAGTLNNVKLTTSATIGYADGTKFTWTPCLNPSGVTIALQGDNSTLDINWTQPSVPPAGGYDYEVRTSGAAGSGPAGLFASGTVSNTSSSVSVPGLNVGIAYTVYVKANCRSTWLTSTPGSITPACVIATVPYVQNFETSVVPAIPPCNTTQVVSGALMQTRDNSSTAYFGFNSKNLTTVGALAQNTWFFTQAIALTGGTSYKISYKYGGTRQQAFFVQRMNVAYGTTASAAGMTTTLAVHDDIKESPLTNTVNFVPATTGTYYFGFRGYANATQGELQVDDIVVDFSACFAPTALTSGQVTSNSAIITWTPPVTAPASGYSYFVSTSNTPPSSTQVPTGTTAAGIVLTTLTGLNPLTTYYYWVRSNCGSGDLSQWSAVGTFTTTAVITYCTPTGSGAQDPRGITNVTFGSINNTTGIETGNYGNYTNLTTNLAQGATVPISITNATGFSYYMHVWVDWNNDGDFADTGELVFTGEAAAPNPSVLNGSFVVPALDSNSNSTLGAHRLRIGGTDFGPFTDPCRSGTYQAYEDYSIFVTAPPPPLTLNFTSDAICQGTTTSVPLQVTSNHSDFQVYTWSPSTGVSGSLATGYFFNPNSTTTYVLTATQTSGNFSSNSVSYTITVSPSPTPITVSPSPVTRCSADAPQALVATGGIIPGVLTTVFEENFNDPTNTFTTVNNSTGGAAPAEAAWTLRPSPYVYSGTFSSNDSSQFYLSNSDDQGSGGTTNTELISPIFSLAGYSSAALSFWHHFDYLGGESANVEISTNGGTSWVAAPLLTYTSDQGAKNNFVNAVLDLSTYVGQTNLRLRFRYVNATWDWWWAIDNVRVYGSNTSEVYWYPTSGLFTDAAGTIPYTGTITSTVYADPNTTTTYFAAADSPNGCSTESAPIVVTVNPITPGTASSNQVLCTGMPSDLTLTGNSDPVTKWQYASNLGFTIGVTDIPASASTTLTSAQMGAQTITRYYRAVVSSGVCEAFSNVITITYNKTTWNGSAWNNGAPDATKAVEFTGNYSGGTISACSVTVISGAVSFGVGQTLTVQNEVRVLGGSLTMGNESSLLQINNVANTGNITYVRASAPVIRYDYSYWSTPVSPQTLAAASPSTSWDGFYTYSGTAWQWAPRTTVMVPGRGYIIRVPLSYSATIPSSQIINFVGVPNNGDYTIPVVGGSNQLNLLGNPYPSALDADLFMSANASVLDGTMYFWTHNTPITAGQYDPDDYAIYNYLGGTGTMASPNPGLNTEVPNGKVASGQGFFIKGLANGSAVFNNTMRIAGNNDQFFRMSTPNPRADNVIEKHRYWIDIFNATGVFKQNLIGYITGGTLGIDRGMDSDVVNLTSPVVLYTKVGDAKLAIQGRGLPFEVTDQIPLAYKTTVATSYTIRLSQFDGLFENQDIYLEDQLLNIIHNLKDSDYTFNTEVGTFENRFVLRYTNSTLGIDTPSFSENTVVVYRNGQGLFVSSGVVAMSQVSVFDIRGRLLADQKQVNATETVFSNLPETQQVLLVKIKAENGVEVTKKVLY